MVERDLAKVEVASSSLVSRSKIFKDEGGRMKDEIIFIHPSSFRLHPFFGRRIRAVNEVENSGYIAV